MAGAEGARAGQLDSLFVGLVALALYLALGQSTLYGVDAWNDLRLLAGGDTRSATHVLYRPIAGWFAARGESVGWSLHESVRAFSAVGAAIGVALMHAASRRLGVSRREAVDVAGWIAVLPGIWFYATVAERHGPFLAFAGLACLVTACWIRSGRTSWAVAFGVACGLAYAAHSTGALLCGLLVPFFAMERHRAARPWLLDSLIAVGVSGLAVVAASRIAFAVGQLTAATGNLEILGEFASVAVQHFDCLPLVAWHEFLLPLVPVSFVWLVRLRDQDGACVVATLGVGILVYLTFAFLVLAGFEAREGFDERGAYLLPLAWPLAHVCVLALGRRLAWIGIAASAAVAIAGIRSHDTRPTELPAAWVRSIEADPRPYLLPACRPDFELLFAEFRDHEPWVPVPGGERDYVDLFHAVHADDHDGARGVAELLPTVLARIAASGRPVVMSHDGIRFLEASRHRDVSVLGPVFLDALRRAFEFRDVPDSGFVRLVPR